MNNNFSINKEFLLKKLGSRIKSGNFVDKNGNILGRHEGYQLYTLGQWRGLGINLSKPVFITEIRVSENEIVLGEYNELLRDKVQLLNYKFNVELEEILGMKLLARPRFSSQGFYGKLSLEDNILYFEYEEKNTHNANGQHLVLFYNNFVLGGGMIRMEYGNFG